MRYPLNLNQNVDGSDVELINDTLVVLNIGIDTRPDDVLGWLPFQVSADFDSPAKTAIAASGPVPLEIRALAVPETQSARSASNDPAANPRTVVLTSVSGPSALWQKE